MAMGVSPITFWHRSAAFVTMLGPGCAIAFFVAMSGFYMNHFQSPTFVAVTILCLYLPSPLVVLLQERADDVFDKQFSTRATYFFRVMVVQLILTAAALAWMFVPQSPYLVLGMAFLIGGLVGVVNSSSMQLVSTLEPDLGTYNRLGNQCGSVLSVAALLVYGFHPYSSLLKFRWAVATVPVVCFLACAYLTFLHFRQNIFEKAFQRLSYDLEDDDLDDVATGAAGRRQFTETSSLDPEASKGGVPSWVWYWCTCIGVMRGTTGCMLGVVGLFGDATLAQLLAVLTLVVAFAGKLAALTITSVPCFAKGPWHWSFASLVLVFAGLTTVVFAGLAGVAVPPAAFFVAWGVSRGLYEWMGSLVFLTTGLYARVEDRKFVARRLTLVMEISNVLGLVVGIAITLLAAGHGNFAWPAADYVIEG